MMVPTIPKDDGVAFVLSLKIYIDPNIAEVGRFLLTWHGLFTAIGIATAVFFSAMFAKRRGILEDDIYSIALWAIPGGIIGARLLYIVENWGTFHNDIKSMLSVNEGGISVYGGLIGGAAAGWAYAWRRKLPMRVISDAAAFGMITGQAIGRMGDFINGEHLAKQTDLPWGFCYTHPRTLAELCGPGTAGVGPVHPVAGVYEPLLLMALFWALLALRRVIVRDGVIFWLYVLGYAGVRFGLSYLRLNESTRGPLTVPQWIALVMAAGAVAALLFIRRLPEKSPRPAPPPPPPRRATRTISRSSRSRPRSR